MIIEKKTFNIVFTKFFLIVNKIGAKRTIDGDLEEYNEIKPELDKLYKKAMKEDSFM